MKLFGLDASRAGAEQLAELLGIELSAHEEREFEDGEFKIRPLESVRDERIYIYHSLASGGGFSANTKLVRLLFFVGALKDAGASSITVIAPYLAYARKDRRTKSRDPISIRYLAQIFEAVGTDEVVTVDVHNPAAFENAFRCRTQNLEAAALFADHFASAAESAKRMVVVSPDSGGVKRARRFADLVSERVENPVELAFMEKHRSEGKVSGGLFAGDVRDSLVIIFDDLISSGTTMRRAAVRCLELGAESVHVAATHGVFGAGASDALSDDAISTIVVTDTVPDVRTRAAAFDDKLVVLASAELLQSVVRD
jgi:ribose-phosphate pyrophosphokinase